jgi:hypothetical protein
VPDLIPVENDPYAVNLQPVDHDPFGNEGAIAKPGQTVQPVNARPMTGQAAMTALGVPDISTMTPDEQQMFALGAVPMLAAGPEAKIAEEVAPTVARGIRAFHGSPYDFERFDLSKIGTGEGAQAYGHGLYFAENPATAQSYRDALSPVAGETLLWPTAGASDLTKQLILAKNGDIDAAIAHAEQMSGSRRTSDLYNGVANELRDIKAKGRFDTSPGKTYEVAINADPEHFLDWDKPLSEQSAHVTNSLRNSAYAGYLDAPELASRTGMQLSPKSDFAAEKLRDAGIPGIKYLDQGSRGDFKIFSKGGDQYGVMRPDGTEYPLSFNKTDAQAEINRQNSYAKTSNYVVFDDKLIDIIKKYGLAGLIAGGAAHFKTTPVDHTPFTSQ